jgi:hypothetical protein
MNVAGHENKYYRPISSLSFGIDYMIWKLNPFGYHLTNLILHILVSISIFFFTRLLLKGEQIIPWLTAIVFTTHPALMSNVPAIARRQDIIAALFLVLSLSLFFNFLSKSGSKKPFLFFSFFSYAIALGTKEISVILFILVFAYLVIFSEKIPFKEKVTYGFRKSFPFFVLTIAYFILRLYMLGGLGGRPEHRLLKNSISFPIEYFSLLLFPLVLPSISNPIINIIKILIPILVIIILTYILFQQNFLSIIRSSKKIFSVFYVLLLSITILSAIGFILSPLALPSIYHLVENIYEKTAPEFLHSAIIAADIHPVEHYLYRAGRLLQGTLLFILLVSGCCLGSLLKFEEIKKFTLSTRRGKSCLFCLIWLILPLGVYLMTSTFTPRCMYIPVIPFSIMLSIGLGEVFRSCRKGWKVYKLYRNKESRNPLAIKAIAFVVLIGLSISLLVASPLMVDYKEWENAGKISSMYLEELSEIVPGLPSNCVVYLYGFPYWCEYLSLTYDLGHTNLLDYSIKSWIDLKFPHTNMEVFVKTYSYLKKLPTGIDMTVESNGKSTRVMAIYKYN